VYETKQHRTRISGRQGCRFRLPIVPGGTVAPHEQCAVRESIFESRNWRRTCARQSRAPRDV